MLAVIMAGGVGERFWPLSRRTHPKQLLDLTGRGSMIRLTVDRLEGLCAPEETYIITNAGQRDAIIEEVGAAVPPENIVGEPQGRNTAPCIALAAVLARKRHGNVPMIVLPADHLVEPLEEFQRAARAGADFVSRNNALLTFGIEPTRPETGYGYIEAAGHMGGVEGAEILRARAFLEKPSADEAERLLARGGYYWNSGMFMWTPETILGEISNHLPELSALMDRIDGELGTRLLPDVLNDVYGDAPSISIDYGVMEKAADVVVLRAGFGWNDVGSWEFVRDVYPGDDAGNVTVGGHVLIDASNNTVFSKDRLIAVLGVDDVVVVDAADTVLICARDRAQDVKKIVQSLKDGGHSDLT